MKKSFLIIFIFFYQFSFGQYKIEPSLQTLYWKIYERLPEEFKKEKDPQFKNGLGLLTGIKTDTLNKNELQPVDTSLKIFSINEESGEIESQIESYNEEERISETEPMWLSCGCKLNGNNLEITTGISMFSGFAVIIKLSKGKAKGVYSEHDTEGNVFRTKLRKKKVSEFTIPATINNLVINEKPKNGLSEIYGKISVTTGSYYSYVNTWSFKNDYIHKRMQLEFYFRCNTKGNH